MSLVHDTVRRLSDATRARAERVLLGEWGRTLSTDYPVLDEVPGFEELSPERQVALADKLIAEHIPVRIEPGELIVGSANYALASYHQVPALYQGKPLIISVSHVTLGFDHALKVGYKGLRAQIEERLSRGDLDERGHRPAGVHASRAGGRFDLPRALSGGAG